VQRTLTILITLCPLPLADATKFPLSIIFLHWFLGIKLNKTVIIPFLFTTVAGERGSPLRGVRFRGSDNRI
jgi:hypothetical protein